MFYGIELWSWKYLWNILEGYLNVIIYIFFTFEYIYKTYLLPWRRKKLQIVLVFLKDRLHVPDKSLHHVFATDCKS